MSATAASCSVFRGPQPNDAVVELARAAEADSAAAASSNHAVAALRAEQAQQLWQEVTRLCGVDESGEPPESCRVDHAADTAGTLANEAGESDTALASGPSAVLSDAIHTTLSGAQDVPSESRALVVTQAVDLVSLLSSMQEQDESAAENCTDLPNSLVETTSSEALGSGGKAASNADEKAAEDLLTWEYSARYLLGQAEAWAGDITELINRQVGCISELQAALAAVTADAIPMADVAYTLPDGTNPTDESTAQDAIAQLAQATAEKWRAAAATAESAEWRAFATLAAGTAERAADEVSA